MAIKDPNWPEHFEKSVFLEAFEEGPYKVFYVVPMIQEGVFYRFRMYLFKGDDDPLLALNFEMTPERAFISRHDEQGHREMEEADAFSPFSEFVNWSMREVLDYLVKEEGYVIEGHSADEGNGAPE
jgi:hypothetical protein